MISCTLNWEKGIKSKWSVIIPHEINNLFLGPARKLAESGKIKGIDYIPSFGDHSKIIIEKKNLDKLYNDFTLLENKLDEVIKIIPLPKRIGELDGYIFPGFISIYMETEEIHHSIDFNKYDMLNIIRIIKIKILEAKEKGETLVFSGD